jgi:NTP pyrophosphatase (non-canonical NTP hydrolase)
MTMEFDEYQKRADFTAQYPDKGANLNYVVLGLASEAGEAAGKLKKIIRDDGGRITAEARARLLAEIGDVLWYAAAVCTELNASLADVARENLHKLASRAARGAIGGSGDER